MANPDTSPQSNDRDQGNEKAHKIIFPDDYTDKSIGEIKKAREAYENISPRNKRFLRGKN